MREWVWFGFGEAVFGCGCRGGCACAEHCAACHPVEGDELRYLWNEREGLWEAEHPDRACAMHQTAPRESASTRIDRSKSGHPITTNRATNADGAAPGEAKNTDPTLPENQAKALERYVKDFLRWALESDKRKAEYGHTPMPALVIKDDPYE